MIRGLTIAKEDARRAFRSRLVWGALGLLGLMFLPSTGTTASPQIHPIGEYLLVIPFELMTFSLVVVGAVGYSAVVNERVNGTVRFILGQPTTRRDLVLGKFLSRVGIVVGALALVLVIANVLVYRGYGDLYLLPFWVMGGWMLAYVVVWCAVTVGYSAAFESPYRTVGALVVTHVIFSWNFGVWGIIVRPMFALLFTGSLDAASYETLATAPLWIRVTERLNPLVDFWYAMRWSIEFVGPGSPTGGPLPHVLGILLFLSFGMLPFVIGVRRFEETDLGGERAGFPVGDKLWRSLWGVRGAILGDASVPRARTRAARIWQIAIADIRHALQNWVLAGALLVTLLIAGPSLWGAIDAMGPFTDTEELSWIYRSFTLPVLLLGIAVGHNAIVGERSDGTARLLLGISVTRLNLFYGKLLSRVGIVVAILLPIILFAEVLVVTRLGRLYLAAIPAWAGWTLLYAIVWTVIIVGISATVSTRYRSLAVAFATYLLFGRDVGLWDPVVRPAIVFIFTGRFSTHRLLVNDVDPPLWFSLSDHINPFVSLETLRKGLFEMSGYGTQHTQLMIPIFLYSAVILILYGVLSIAVGVRRFENCDLG